MTCADLEILLCDYLDGTLASGERTALENHIARCRACAELARDAAGLVGFLEVVPRAEPPGELLTRILRQIPERRPWWSRLFDGWLEGLLQPRFVMGAAMTILSVAMLAELGQIGERDVSRADLNPARVWQRLDDGTYRMWDRTVKYYDDMPLLTDLRSQWSEWSEQNQDGTAGQ